MSLIADGLLLIAAMSAAIYCAILSRRLSRLSGLDDGLGKAIVSLSSRVDEMKAALADAKRTTDEAQAALALKVDLAARQADDLSALIDQARETVREYGVAQPAPPAPQPDAMDQEDVEAAVERLIAASRKSAQEPRRDETQAAPAAPKTVEVEAPEAKAKPVEEKATAEAVPETAEEAPEPSEETQTDAETEVVTAAAEEPTAPEPVARSAPRKSLGESLEVIRRARDSDDDEAFAARLVDALAALQPAGSGGGR